VERNDVLRRAREDLAGVRSVAAAWEAEVASARTQLQQDRATLEGAQAWQSQAEERAKEDDPGGQGCRARRGGGAPPSGASRAPAGGDPTPAGACCSRRGPGCTRAGALGAGRGAGSTPAGANALEGTQAALKQREDEASKLNEELVQLSISHEDLCQSLEE
jgi:hypothetical protein